MFSLERWRDRRIRAGSADLAGLSMAPITERLVSQRVKAVGEYRNGLQFNFQKVLARIFFSSVFMGFQTSSKKTKSKCCESQQFVPTP